MATAILSLFAALTVFIVLTDSITIDLKIGENYIITVNFMVFAITFKRDKNERNGRFSKKSKRKKNNHFWYSLLMLIIPRSSIKINSLHVILPDGSPHINSISYGIAASLISSFIVFLEYNSKFFEATNIRISYSEHNTLKKELEAEFKISILDLLIIATVFFAKRFYYRLLKTRIRKVNE